MYKVVEIFQSIEGEGKRSGRPATFIRFAGCNLRCDYCDTAYALFGEKEECRYTEMTLEEILNHDIKNAVTLTGGEPLLAEGIAELVDALLLRGAEVNIETNGATDIMPLIEQLDIHEEEKVFFTIDYKLPSSFMEDKMLFSNFESLMPHDVVKFVVADDNDYERMLEITEKLARIYDEMPHIYIGAVYGRYPLDKLAEKITNEPLLQNANMQLQIHKIIWDAEKRGV